MNALDHRAVTEAGFRRRLKDEAPGLGEPSSPERSPPSVKSDINSSSSGGNCAADEAEDEAAHYTLGMRMNQCADKSYCPLRKAFSPEPLRFPGTEVGRFRPGLDCNGAIA